MNIILLGPPGAGKGTVASKIKNILGLKHLSTGDMLREEIKKGSALGNKAQEYIEQGRINVMERININEAYLHKYERFPEKQRRDTV